MTPHTALAAEIYLVVANAETAASLLRLKHAVAGSTPFGALEDARTEVIGELLAAIDRAEPGLGTRLQQAMYPLTPDEEAHAS